MEFHNVIFIIISVVSSVSSFTISDERSKEVPENLHRDSRDADSRALRNVVTLPTYSVYLIGFTILILLIAVIVLAVALYRALKKKSMFGINPSNKQYVRQESTGITALCNATYEEDNKNNGSTLTVNSGVIEISEPRISNPTTPIRAEDPKIIFARKPQVPTIPLMQKEQIDAVCREVLNRVQKTDSASYRDLKDLLKFEKSEENIRMKGLNESEDEDKNDEKTRFEIGKQLFKLKKPQIKTEALKEIKTETKDETNHETNKPKIEIKPEEGSDIRIEVTNVESDKNDDDSDVTEYDTVPTPIKFRHSDPEPDQGLYDTVPSPTRYRHSGPEHENYEQNEYDTVPRPKSFRSSGLEFKNAESDESQLYDLPPSRSDESPKTIIQMDLDTHYLVPISAEKTDSCYVNAKRQP